ncbi:MAG: PEP-CTERM sorting domain-containing protein [Sedimentisphaerales bacterium]|nr:PEP-CTERM sorting domain-containing protein [Sedimentisphaerales bacterium]
MKISKINSVKSVLVATVLMAGTAVAVDRDWTGAAGDNNWFNSANWTPAGSPGYADDLDIGSGFTIDAATTVFQYGLSDISITGSTVNMNGTGANGSFYGGNSSVNPSFLRLNSSAVLNTRTTLLATGGLANVIMSGSTWNMLSNTYLGYSGTCDLSLNYSSYINSASLITGHTASAVFTGTLANSSQINSAEIVYLGNSGKSDLSINSGADLISSRSIYMANNSSSESSLSLSGSGSTLLAGSTSYGALYCGYNGTASLNVSGGGRVSADDVNFGSMYGSVANVNIAGPGSVIESSGHISCGTSGTANVNVGDYSLLDARYGTLSIGNYGVLNINNGTVLCNSLSGTGRVNFNSGALTVVSDLVLDGLSPLGNIDLSADHQLTVSGTLTVAPGTTARFDQAMVRGGSLMNKSDIYIQSGGDFFVTDTATNKGSVYMNGGKFGGATLKNSFGSLISGEGQIYSNNTISNYGTITSTGYLEANQRVYNYGTINVGYSSYSFNTSSEIHNLGNIALNGAVSASNFVNHATGIVSGSGYIDGDTDNPGGQIYANGGVLTIERIIGNYDNGELKIENNATMQIMNTFQNDAMITLNGNGARMSVAGHIDNNGVISGAGRMAANIINAGGINAQGGTLQVGAINNTTTGLVEVQDGATLIAVDGMSFNEGSLNLYGGKFDNARNDLISSGSILGHGTLTASTITNQNYVGVGDGDLTIVADDFYHYGIVDVQDGSTLTFYGDVSGYGSFTGDGSVVFLSGYTPGVAKSASPIAFAGDVATVSTLTMELAGTLRGVDYSPLFIAGEFSVDGVLDIQLVNGFVAAYGDSFDLFDFDTISGTFTSIITPTLPGELSFDLSDIYTTGVVTVVPEPASMALLTGAALLAVRRRK